MTDFSTIRKALEKRLSAISGIPSIAWENVDFNPDSVDSWLRAKIVPTAQRPASVGINSQIKHEGIFLVDCMIRINKSTGGAAQLDALTKLIQDSFAYGTIIEESGLKIMIRFSERGEERTDPPWSFAPVTINFYSFI